MNVLPTIVQEVVSQCKKQGFAISAALASFYIRCQLLTAEKDQQNNVELTPEHVERLVNNAVRTLTLTDSPMLEMFKLQASISTAQQEQVNKIRTEKVQHKAKSHRLMEEIWAKKDPNEVFGDITMYILHETRSPMGSEAVQRETMAALESVYPKALMDGFISQDETEKVRQLEEIWRIVWGIRVHGAHSKAGGTGIPDLITETQQAITDSLTACHELVERIQQKAKEYAAVLGSPSLNLTDSQRMRLQDEYHNRLQVKVYLTSLISTVKKLQGKVEDFVPGWDAAINDVSSIIANTENTVPKSAIYPRFIALSERWDVLFALHREAIDNTSLRHLIESYRASFNTALRESDVEHALSGVAEERAPNRDLIANEIKNGAVEYLHSLDEEKLSRLEFNGFCVVALMDDGVLLEGKTDPKLSPGFILLQANSAYYSFSSERALKRFAADPFKYLSKQLMDTVANNSVLIHLIGLQPYLPKELYLAGSRKHDVTRMVEKGDGSTQTGHIDDYKDTHYVWNEWELRRLALKLAGLRTKRTKGMQTNLSHFRRDNDSQAYPPKEQSTQTLVEKAVQPPTVVRYIKGLRGTETSKLETVEKVFQH